MKIPGSNPRATDSESLGLGFKKLHFTQAFVCLSSCAVWELPSWRTFCTCAPGDICKVVAANTGQPNTHQQGLASKSWYVYTARWVTHMQLRATVDMYETLWGTSQPSHTRVMMAKYFMWWKPSVPNGRLGARRGGGVGGKGGIRKGPELAMSSSWFGQWTHKCVFQFSHFITSISTNIPLVYLISYNQKSNVNNSKEKVCAIPEMDQVNAGKMGKFGVIFLTMSVSSLLHNPIFFFAYKHVVLF